MKRFKKTYFILLTLCVVLLTACASDSEEYVDITTPTTGQLSADSVTISLRVRIPAAWASSTDKYYFHNEYTISSLYIYFFDANTKRLFTRIPVTGLTQNESNPDPKYDITYFFEDIRLRAGIYDIFTIANYDYVPEEVTDEAEFLNMVDSLTYQDGIEANMPEKGPVMTNRATSLLAVDFLAWINKYYVLNVELERVVAKLELGVSQDTFSLTHEGQKYADINITNYKLVNLNRRYYLFQHRDSLPELAGQPEFTLPFHFSDYNDNGEQYVVDPYFYEKTPDIVSAARFSAYYKSWFGDFTTSDFASMPSMAVVTWPPMCPILLLLMKRKRVLQLPSSSTVVTERASDKCMAVVMQPLHQPPV